MLRVYCVDDKPRIGEVAGINPVEGETYAVAEIGYGECDVTGKIIQCYRIKELLNPPNDWHDRDRFIPLSEISETQMERNYQTLKINV